MRLAHRVVLAWGWRRALIAFGAGALSVLGLAPTDLWPVMFLTFPVLVWLVDGAAAGRFGGARERIRGRLVVRLRLFLRGALLDRPRLPGRRQDVRLASAIRDCRAARGHGDLHGSRPRLRARDLGTRPHPRPVACDRTHGRRVVARAPVHRISVEHVWLRTDRAAGTGADRIADRHLGPDIHCRRGIRDACPVRRRSCRHAPALAAAARGRRCCCAGSPVGARGGCLARRRSSSATCGCGSCSRTCSRTRSSTTPRGTT